MTDDLVYYTSQIREAIAVLITIRASIKSFSFHSDTVHVE